MFVLKSRNSGVYLAWAQIKFQISILNLKISEIPKKKTPFTLNNNTVGGNTSGTEF
jgi:hypothetical protein